MINAEEFRKYAHQFADWMADYFENVTDYPVKSQVNPGEIFNLLPDSAPLQSETMDSIFKDFTDVVLKGITHWQSPNFFAYFPANSSYPSVLAEMLTAAIAPQCMIWDTSPAAAELEEKVMIWLRKMIGLPDFFEGVIQDTASTATLTAILSAREKYSDFKLNQTGFVGNEKFRVYCSSEAHSSVDKAVKIAGIGKDNLVKIDTDENLRMIPIKLREAIQNDIKAGKKPLCIVAAIGTTGTVAIDPLKEIAKISNEFGVWLHVDAAFAGTALVLPECRWMIEGIELADSFVFNPHKWMFTNFDCSAYFAKDKGSLIRTFEILPEYLKTSTKGAVNNYRDWGIPLGRRFRALKLWFVLRNFGVENIQKIVRTHIEIAKDLAINISKSDDFELITPQSLSFVCFRFKPKNLNDLEKLNQMNEQLLKNLNSSGKLYLSHTKVKGIYTIRFVIAQTYVTKEHMIRAWDLIQKEALELKKNFHS